MMNSVRIGLIGVTVDLWGRTMAEGLLHDMEGWVVFMICTAMLIAEVWLLTRFSGDKRPLRDVFNVEFPENSPSEAAVRFRPLSKSFMAAMIVLATVAFMAKALPEAQHLVPDRKPLTQFPLSVDGWNGRAEPMPRIYLDQLKLTDYLLTNYVDTSYHLVNLYVSYYDVQSNGNSAHSPRDCIPGDGWEVKSLPWSV